MSSPEVEHVLPFSFVLEDRTWNLVVACRKCNNDKRDRLTDIDSLKRLCARNERITSGDIHPAEAFRRDIDEWRLRDLSAHVLGLYEHAMADGFPRWK
jgi:hypothetical protein